MKRAKIQDRADAIHRTSQWTTEHASEISYEMMFLDSKQEQKMHRVYGAKLQDISYQIMRANTLMKEITVAIRKEQKDSTTIEKLRSQGNTLTS